MRVWKVLGLIIALLICGGVAFAALAWRAEIAAVQTFQKFDPALVQKGAELAAVGNCIACHTIPGNKAFAGGLALPTPFGTIHSTNITPDRETGIGKWSEAAFSRAMREGVDREGDHLYPAFPYDHFTHVTDEDNQALYAYLITREPVQATAPANDLMFPLGFRPLLALWNLLYLDQGPFQSDPSQSDEWNRGAYLAEGLTHCGMCHTPKNALGGDDSANALRGYALQGWFAPDITNDPRRGIGSWSIEEIAAYLKTGHNKTSAATGLMAEMVNLSTSQMTDADLKAIAVYLKDQPAKGESGTQSGVKADEKVMKMGAAIYADECSGCHGADGKGAAGLFPSLNGAPVVQQNDATSLLHVVLRGARSAATAGAPTGAAMPQFAWVLTDDQVAAVVSYIRNAWGNSAPPVSATEVGKARRAFAERSD
jgi:mono/diheme cytochrome c family protein